MARRNQVTPEERRESVLAAINGLPARRSSKPPNSLRLTVDFLIGAAAAVNEAARGRRVSVASYIRRAALAMAAHDLKMPLRDILTLDPRIARETGFSVPDPDGVRFGSWEIETLAGEGVEREPAEE